MVATHLQVGRHDLKGSRKFLLSGLNLIQRAQRAAYGATTSAFNERRLLDTWVDDSMQPTRLPSVARLMKCEQTL